MDCGLCASEPSLLRFRLPLSRPASFCCGCVAAVGEVADSIWSVTGLVCMPSSVLLRSFSCKIPSALDGQRIGSLICAGQLGLHHRGYAVGRRPQLRTHRWRHRWHWRWWIRQSRMVPRTCTTVNGLMHSCLVCSTCSLAPLPPLAALTNLEARSSSNIIFDMHCQSCSTSDLKSLGINLLCVA